MDNAVIASWSLSAIGDKKYMDNESKQGFHPKRLLGGCWSPWTNANLNRLKLEAAFVSSDSLDETNLISLVNLNILLHRWTISDTFISATIYIDNGVFIQMVCDKLAFQVTIFLNFQLKSFNQKMLIKAPPH